MSQWHVTIADGQANSFRIVFHIPVPSVNNLATFPAAVNYQTALVNSGVSGTTKPAGKFSGGSFSAGKSSMATGTGPGQITSAELANITNGSLLEVVETYNSNPGDSGAQKVADLGARFTQLADTSAAGAVLPMLQNELAYFGQTSTS